MEHTNLLHFQTLEAKARIQMPTFPKILWVTSIITISVNLTFAQNDSSSSSRPIGYWVILDSINDCSTNAIQDIQKSEVKLYIIGGIAPVIYADQAQFEERFGIKYFDSGCDASFNECMMQYNLLVFNFLDKKYGKSWRRQVRKDVLGFKSWRRSNLFSPNVGQWQAIAYKKYETSNNDLFIAWEDFKKGEARLYCQGGLSPSVDRKNIKRFYKNYRVIYHDLGCATVKNMNELLEYNEAVFELLTFKFGLRWQALVRVDTIGLEEWQKKQGH